MYFSYVFAEIKRLISEIFVRKLGIVCNIMDKNSAAIKIDKMNVKNKMLLLFVQTYQKRKKVPYMEMSRGNDKKRCIYQ